MKRVVSCILMLVLTFSSSKYLVFATQNFNTSVSTEGKKLSDELLAVLDISYDEIISHNYSDNGEVYSCIIWINDIEMEEAVKTGIDAAERTRDTYTTNSTYDYPYTIIEVNGMEVVEVELDQAENSVYVDTYIEAERNSAAEMYSVQNNRFVEEYFEFSQDIVENVLGSSFDGDSSENIGVNYISSYSPCIFADLNLTKIAALIEVEQVQSIGYWNSELLEVDEDLAELAFGDSEWNEFSSTFIPLATIDRAKSDYGVSGNNVKIGQYEANVPTYSTVVKHPVYNNSKMGGAINFHPNNVYDIMHEIAPDATYYACGRYPTNSTTLNVDFATHIEWLLDNGVNIINMSLQITEPTVSPLNTYNTYNDIARWIDHIEYNHDVHVVVSAGNAGANGVTVPGMAYNIITVGSVDANMQIASNSSYCNITPSTSSFITHKPDISAPGQFSSGRGGTSYAAPMITGTIALMCEYQPTLKTKQHIVKAILAASTSKSRRYVTSNVNFKKYGSGMLNARAALWIINKGRFVATTGVFSSTAPQTKTYQFEVLSSDSTMRVALAYSNRINFSSSTHGGYVAPSESLEIAEIKLFVKDPSGNVVASSIVEGANLKIIQFTPTVYGTYAIEVKQTQAAESGRTTNFGLAWY